MVKWKLRKLGNWFLPLLWIRFPSFLSLVSFSIFRFCYFYIHQLETGKPRKLMKVWKAQVSIYWIPAVVKNICNFLFSPVPSLFWKILKTELATCIRLCKRVVCTFSIVANSVTHFLTSIYSPVLSQVGLGKCKGI